MLKSSSRVLMFLTLFTIVACNGSSTGPSEPYMILNGPSLSSGFDIILNTDRGRTDWLSHQSESVDAAYPRGQAWGFVAVVVAGTAPGGGRPGQDFSGYSTLEIQLRGETGGEAVELGIKDNRDPDTGEETKKQLTITNAWQTYSFALTDFKTADLKNLNLVVELVFVGTEARTVHFRNLRYLP